MTESPVTLKEDRFFRLRIAGGAFCWAVIGVASLAISRSVLWYPSIVGLLALLTAAFTAALALRPAHVIAYRYGGTFAVGTLVMRMVTVVEGELRLENPQLIWVTMSQVAITALLAGTYAWAWLHEVKDWHRAHRILDT